MKCIRKLIFLRSLLAENVAQNAQGKRVVNVLNVLRQMGLFLSGRILADVKYMPACRSMECSFAGYAKNYPCDKLPKLILWNPNIIDLLSRLRDEYERCKKN